jgi:flagellar motor protein MotB
MRGATSIRVVTVGALCAVAAVGFSGCASKMKERNRILEAENIDQRQQIGALETQVRDANAAQDAALADVKNKEAELANARAEATANQMAAARLAQVEADLKTSRDRLEEANRRLAMESRPAPSPGRAWTSNPQTEAFRQDLQSRLAQFHVTGVDVDVRTAKDGEQRVAVVLQNSFRPGGASLSYNTSAVKAIVGLGKLVADSYPGSRVSIEGHTDSDPIRKSKWESNESLSLARAEEVKSILGRAGVSQGRIAAVGMGAHQPIAKGATERAKAQNRRVEIFIYPNG